MKIFLSALDNAPTCSYRDETGKRRPFAYHCYEILGRFKWNLMSYYYLRGKDKWNIATFIRDRSEEVLIDSGAHSFQKGKKVDWVQYTKEYAEFIKKFDRPNVIGYFEMDVDNVLGYEKVLELRKILESVSDKIIPVWHKNRGIKEYKKMCRDYAGKIVAITGFKNEDISDDQYIMFLKYAKKYGCKVHCLGMTRKNILDKVPFDYTDSSSWLQQSVFGRIGQRKVKQEWQRKNNQVVFTENYRDGMKMQTHYYNKWKHFG